MTNLIARIESADGPDRELDVAIHESIGNVVDRGCPADWHSEDETPRYTASVDAALTLVPEDWHTQLSGVNGSWCAVLTHTPFNSCGEVSTFCRTPALALAAAALKARGV